VSDGTLRCAWCNGPVGDGGALPWDGSGVWPRKGIPYCCDEHRTELLRFAVFSRRHYFFAQLMLYCGLAIYLIALFLLPSFRPQITALVALDIGLTFYLYPFPPPFLLRGGLRRGRFIMRVLALVIIGAGFLTFARAVT
jgi:hypothetical protein